MTPAFVDRTGVGGRSYDPAPRDEHGRFIWTETMPDTEGLCGNCGFANFELVTTYASVKPDGTPTHGYRCNNRACGHIKPTDWRDRRAAREAS